MIVYRAVFSSETDGSAGCVWSTRRRDVLRAAREYRDQDDGNSFEIQRITIKVTVAGVLDALGNYAAHPDNG